MGKMSKYRISFILALCGFGVWVFITEMFNLREAWDGRGSAPFFISMLALNFVAGFIEPDRRILKGILSVSLQPLAIFIKSGEVGSMFPLGMVAFFVLGMLFSLGVAVGALLKREFFTPGRNS